MYKLYKERLSLTQGADAPAFSCLESRAWILVEKLLSKRQLAREDRLDWYCFGSLVALAAALRLKCHETTELKQSAAYRARAASDRFSS